MKKVIIDASTNIPYGSFYIKGLVEKYGRQNVKFRSKPFVDLPPVGWNVRYIVKEKNNKVLKVFIHTNDTYHIDKAQYDWCDVYGHVNVNYKNYPIEIYPKQVSLVPSFGIRNFNIFETIYYSVTNFLMTYKDIMKRNVYNKELKQHVQNPCKNIRRHFLNYIKNYLNREKIEIYENNIGVKKGYIFFLSTLWYSDEYNKNDDGVNRRRATFIEVCKNLKNCIFEGGLLTDNSSTKKIFEESTTNIRQNLPTWINKTKESELVFNTPAFWDCHGWKLGEFLAIGKAIISTPLSNDLPEPLIHGKHIHFIPDSSKESISKAVLYILQNPDYRQNLENNAKKYWDTYGTPYKSINLLHSDEK
jgi:glycosyltransferase involved in cell wall biosynthesis